MVNFIRGSGFATANCQAPAASAKTKAGPSNCPIALQLRIDERRNIGRELHDSTAQLLVALQLNVACLRKRVGAGADGHTLLSEIDHLLTELHREVRTVSAIAPEAPLRGRDLVLALSEMASNFSRLTGVQVRVSVHGDSAELSDSEQTALYRIAQEAVANAARHGRANRISIAMKFDRPGPAMVVEDDGGGIDPNATEGLGLGNIRQRVDELGGLLSVRRLDRGTRISVSILRPVSG